MSERVELISMPRYIWPDGEIAIRSLNDDPTVIVAKPKGRLDYCKNAYGETMHFDTVEDAAEYIGAKLPEEKDDEPVELVKWVSGYNWPTGESAIRPSVFKEGKLVVYQCGHHTCITDASGNALRFDSAEEAAEAVGARLPEEEKELVELVRGDEDGRFNWPNGDSAVWPSILAPGAFVARPYGGTLCLADIAGRVIHYAAAGEAAAALGARLPEEEKELVELVSGDGYGCFDWPGGQPAIWKSVIVEDTFVARAADSTLCFADQDGRVVSFYTPEEAAAAIGAKLPSTPEPDDSNSTEDLLTAISDGRYKHRPDLAVAQVGVALLREIQSLKDA